MAMRVCSQPGCPTLTRSGKCDRHRREADKARGTRQERGYTAAHQRERAQWKRILDRRPWPCARCGEWIQIGDAWDLGHDDHDRSKWVGPEHPACNRATAGRK